MASDPNSPIEITALPNGWIVQGTDPQGVDISLVGKIEESSDEKEHNLPVVRP